MGVFDVMSSFQIVNEFNGRPAAPSPFTVDLVGETKGSMRLASGVSIDVARSIESIDATDIVIVPSLVLPRGGWKVGRYPRLVSWLGEMHRRGAVLCSACSGIFLLGETGLFDGKDVTVHFGYA